MLHWQIAQDVDFRILYLESIYSKGMHISMARNGWKVSHVSLEHDEEQVPVTAQES